MNIDRQLDDDLSDESLDATISVYLDTSQVRSYTVKACDAREHVSKIQQNGYRYVDDDGTLVWLPAHRIDKVKATNQSTLYKDAVRGT